MRMHSSLWGFAAWWRYSLMPQPVLPPLTKVRGYDYCQYWQYTAGCGDSAGQLLLMAANGVTWVTARLVLLRLSLLPAMALLLLPSLLMLLTVRAHNMPALHALPYHFGMVCHTGTG
jgi:hypothetical protein